MKNVLFIMPFGTKEIQVFDNGKNVVKRIDYDKLYLELSSIFTDNKTLKNKTNDEFCVYRVDQLYHSDIMSKMYKAIMAADIVIADLSGLNPNVMYELGVRHSLKERITVMINSVKDSINNIPFDIGTFTVHDLDDFKLNWWRIFASEMNDSPVLNEISFGNDYSNVFTEFSSRWDKFIKDFNKFDGNIGEQYSLINDYKDDFKGYEEFDQKLAYVNYKYNSESLSSLLFSWDIIEPYFNISIDGETLGLFSSISRKIFENHQKVDLIWYQKSLESVMNYISKFRYSYSFSSLLLHWIAAVEKGVASYEEALSYLKIYYQDLISMDIGNRDEYYPETLSLWELFITRKLIKHNLTDKAKIVEKRIIELMK